MFLQFLHTPSWHAQLTCALVKSCSFEQHFVVHVHVRLHNQSMNSHPACDLAVLCEYIYHRVKLSFVWLLQGGVDVCAVIQWV